jgi:hypothetical protein
MAFCFFLGAEEACALLKRDKKMTHSQGIVLDLLGPGLSDEEVYFFQKLIRRDQMISVT